MRPGLLAFAATCVFSGAALYINIVEQPSRLALDARSIIREWVLSNRRGFVLLAVLAVISSLAGCSRPRWPNASSRRQRKVNGTASACSILRWWSSAPKKLEAAAEH
jgi:hypothetical protein